MSASQFPRSARALRQLSLLIPALVALGAHSAPANAGVEAPFSFSQVDFRGAPNSRIGAITIDVPLLLSQISFSPAYVNVAAPSGGWIVRNLPVLPPSQFDGRYIRTRFDLSFAAPLNGIDVTAAPFAVSITPAPLLTYASTTFSIYPVGRIMQADGGGGDGFGVLAGFRPPPVLALVVFFPFPITIVHQFGHPNIQAALNQCAPAAMANSLQFLENTTPLVIPHDNVPGIKPSVDPNDTSLVGQLEEAMQRKTSGRADPNSEGAWPLDGKLKYISDNGLDCNLIVKHQGDPNSFTGGDPNDVALDGNADVSRYGVTSHGRGVPVDHDWILGELADGEDVELDLAYKGLADPNDPNSPIVVIGRHAVEATGGGTILGVPYITHVSDHEQTDTDPNDVRGTDVVDFEWIVNGNYAVNSNARIDQAISQSYKCAEDIDGDGDVDSQDLAFLLASFEAGDGGDVDCDGDTDPQDLAFLLARFDQPCP